MLAVVARDDNSTSPDERKHAVAEVMRVAESLIGHAFPDRHARFAVDRWVSPRGATAAVSWSNEAGHALRPYEVSSRHGWVSLVGYSARDLDMNALLGTQDLLESSTKLPGCFGILRASEGRVEVVTDATRSNGLYVVETELVRIASSRAVLAKLAASATVQNRSLPVVRPDIIGGRHMAVAGYYLGNRTPFLGVTAIAPSTHVDLTSSQRRHRSSDVEYEPQRDDFDRASAIDDTAASLVAAFDAIPRGRLSLSLTGGRDSRLLAAALANLGEFDVHTLTIGTSEDPDVAIAKLVAGALGFPHELVPPPGVAGDDVVWAEDPVSRIVRVLDVYDGMTSAWDGTEDYPTYSPVATMSGAGGEILRGSGAWRERMPLSTEMVTVGLRNGFLGGRFVHPDMRRAAAPDGGEILELVRRDPYRAADDLYRVHRAGRWAAARRSSERAWRDNVDPFLDNAFVRTVLRVHPLQRWQERFTFDLIATLAPPLRDLPIEGKRWHFERVEPQPGSPADEVAAWGQRYAMTRPGAVDQYLWHKLKNPAMRGRLTALLLDGVNGPAAEIFDRAALEEYLAEGPPPANLWNIATAVVSIQTPWFRTVRSPLVSPIEIRL